MALYTYPSNKLEYLVEILSKLLDYEQKDVFSPTQLVIPSRGMQHWLSVQLAQKRGITMNLNYDMLNSYIINFCYKITNKHDCAKAYTKDVLSWRIYKLIDNLNCDNFKKYYANNNLKKYQLAIKIAEVFSKYISYREDWLKAWERTDPIWHNRIQQDQQWQMQLWSMLTDEVKYTPYKVLELAKTKLTNLSNLESYGICKNIYIFGINTISPKNLDFIYHLAKYVDIHLLYVNPCSEYWYDFKKDKISAWLGQDDYELQPLLANLGQQGKEFFSQLLENEEKQEFNIFEGKKNQSNFKKLEKSNQSQLVSLQRNLLELNCNNYAKTKDNSILISSCHSQLREVQVLHDKLLDIISEDKNIKAGDILVICPNIQNYAAYIDSVFSKYEIEKDKLPCLVADTTLLNSEPIVASFIELLKLPETNFEVNKILDYLSVASIQQKFAISEEQLETISFWLKESCVHSGNNGETFSWSWGLKRLMLGFSYADKAKILDDQLLTVPIVDENEITKLGELYRLLELLAQYSTELNKLRDLQAWQDYLLEMLEDFFDVTINEQHLLKRIKEIIAKTVEIGKSVLASQMIDLNTIRYCLTSELAKPIINNHFLSGKVTFCSMSPMRGIPFKVIAILGLNNGKFPRQDLAVNFDLMAASERRCGDRTVKDDDRYLFLESILSARKFLYLSYIGRSIKTNSKQEPSIVLKELSSYLISHYDWQESDIKEYPLHAFSHDCYSKDYLSHNKAWFALMKKKPVRFFDNDNIKPLKPNLPIQIKINQLVNIFDNPLKAYAKNLELVFDDFYCDLDDNEPFDIDALAKHDLKQQLVASLADQEISIDTVKKINKLSGKFPESFLTDEVFNQEHVKIKNLLLASKIINAEKKLYRLDILEHKLIGHCYVDDNSLKLFTTSKFTIKHKFELYLTLLLANACDNTNHKASYFYIDKEKVKNFNLYIATNTQQINKSLEQYLLNAQEILSKPKLAHLDLAEALLLNKDKTVYDKIIYDQYSYKSLNKDPYFNLFYPQYPQPDKSLVDVYKSFFELLN